MFVCLLLVLTAISTAPSHQRSKRQEEPLPQQGSANPTRSQNRKNTPRVLPAGSNSNHSLNIPGHDQDHENVNQSITEFSNDEGSLNVSVSAMQIDTASTVQKTVKDSATLQLEKLIEDHRLANMKHRERQLQQLEAAKAQLEKQIENQKQLQMKWLEDKMIESTTISEVVEEEYTNGSLNNSYTDEDSVMLSKAIQNNGVEIKDKVYKSTETTLTYRKELKTNESEEDKNEEDQGTKLVLAGSVSDNKNQGHEEVSKKEQKNTKPFDLASDNGEDVNEDTSGKRLEDYTTEIGLQFEINIQEETPLFDKEELEVPDKASSKLDIPQEVSDAVYLVSRYFLVKKSNNLSAPEYVWRAVEELSNYLN